MANDRDRSTRPRAFVIRVMFDERGELRGQLTELGSVDEWRATFVGADELWSALRGRFAVLPAQANRERNK